MKSKIFIILAVLYFNNNVIAQFNETIRTGRPGQAIGPFSVGKNVFQIQSGIDLGGFNDKVNRFKNSYSKLNTVLRFGLGKNVEINSGWDYQYDRFVKSDSVYRINGLNASTIGTRIHLLDSKGYLPDIGLQITFKLPIVADAYNIKHVAPKILFIASKNLSPKFSLLSNFGISYNGNDSNPDGLYVLNLGYSLSTKWGVFVENYGTFSKNNYEGKWDAGIAYLYNDNLQFDLYGGISKENSITDYFTSAGISWRFHSRRNLKR